MKHWNHEYQHMIHLHFWAYDQFVRMTVERNGDYSMCQVQFPQFHIISQYFQHWSCSPYKFQKTWSTSFHSHINLAWRCKIWLFKELWKASLGCMSFNCSNNAVTGRFAITCYKKHPFSTNTKIILMGTQIHKVLVVFVLSSAIVRKLN